jgi:hypothetical protein
MQAGNSNNSDGDRRHAKQQEMITKVVTWLKEEGREPEERTDLHGDARYFALVRIKKAKKKDQSEETREEEAFHMLFPKNRLDCLTITVIIAMDEQGRKSYESFGRSQEGILEKNRFYYNLKLALLQMNVIFALKKNIRQIQSVEVDYDVYFDGLTKDAFFSAIYTVLNAIEIAKTKLYQFRDLVMPSKAGRTDDSEDLK